MLITIYCGCNTLTEHLTASEHTNYPFKHLPTSKPLYQRVNYSKRVFVLPKMKIRVLILKRSHVFCSLWSELKTLWQMFAVNSLSDQRVCDWFQTKNITNMIRHIEQFRDCETGLILQRLNSKTHWMKKSGYSLNILLIFSLSLSLLPFQYIKIQHLLSDCH